MVRVTVAAIAAFAALSAAVAQTPAPPTPTPDAPPAAPGTAPAAPAAPTLKPDAVAGAWLGGQTAAPADCTGDGFSMTFDVKDSTVTLTVVPQTAGKKGENPVVTEFTVSPTVPSTVSQPTRIGLFLVSASKGTAAGVAMTGADTAEWIPAGTGSEYATTAVFMRKCPAAAEGAPR